MSKTPKNKEKETVIYTLANPITGEIRYIGKTVKTLSQRLTDHIYSVKRESNYRINWINSILKMGYKPLIEPLDACFWDKSQELETYWISQFKAWGFNLVNLTNGGEGNLGLGMSDKHKEKLMKINSKEVHQYDIEGIYLQSFSSVAEAGRLTGYSKISSCTNGKRRLAGGYRWSYEKVEKLEIIRPSLKGTFGKRIKFYYKEEQKLFTELCKEHNINYQTVRSRLNRGYNIERALTEKVHNIKNKYEE